MSLQAFRLRSVEAFAYRYPLATPVVTSFGTMRDRPAVLVRVSDGDGHAGWGEVWANFPSTGAEHRVRIVSEILAPLLVDVDIGRGHEAFEHLSARTAVLALQCGEPGPFAQSIAGIDIAVWDLLARREQLPLWRMLGGSDPTICVYASGINPSGTRAQAEAALKRGHSSLKVKIGFDPAKDRENLQSLRDLLGPLGMLATDANQAWDVETSIARAHEIEEFAPAWLEEPIRCDRPWREWQRLRSETKIPLAAGENIAGGDAFAQAFSDDTLSIVQPDMAKWGGFSACVPIARDIRQSGKTFCPHYLGGGIGLLASAHLLAGVGGNGLLELDCNDNPLRDDFCGPVANVADGRVTLSDAPGLGTEPDIASIERYRTG